MRGFWSLIVAAPMIWAAPALQPVRLEVAPRNPLLFGKGSTQRLSIVAYYPDGSSRDVSGQARFTSSRLAVATVESGVVRGLGIVKK